MRKGLKILLFALTLLAAACGTKKVAVQEKTTTTTTTKTETKKAAVNNSFAMVQKVNDTKVTADNIVADLSFSATMGDNNVSVPGSLHMRKGEMIRLQLFVPILHTEVGRLEFTPDYVLVVDRIHKEYIKEDYTKVDFLRANGINFNSLEALFWNQLFLPGTATLTESDLQKFVAKTDETAQKCTISLNAGNMAYTWNANAASGLISNALVTYASAQSGKSSLTWKYSNFKSVGAKMFPAYEEFTLQTTATKKAQTVKVCLDMDDISTSSKWSTETSLSSKYKKIEATSIFGKLLNM